MILTKRKASRRILDGDIFFLSLVDAGANEVVPVLKGKNLVKVQSLAKMSKEGLLHTLVYGPDRVDTDGDTADRSGVQKLAHNFIPNMVGSGIDVMHNCQPVDPNDAHVCESFIIQKNGDDRFKGVTLDGRVIQDTSELEGWWASIIKLNAPELREPFESGEWTGVSMYGSARVESVSKSDFTQALADRLGSNSNQENTMDEKVLAELLAKSIAPLIDEIKTLKKGADPAPTVDPVTETATATIEFEGDMDNLEDVVKHEEKIFRSSLDFNKAVDLKKWRNYLAEKAADEVKAKEAAESNDSDELKKAKTAAKDAERRVAELSKASNQSVEDVRKNESEGDKITRIRKNAKDTVDALLISQGRRSVKS